MHEAALLEHRAHVTDDLFGLNAAETKLRSRYTHSNNNNASVSDVRSARKRKIAKCAVRYFEEMKMPNTLERDQPADASSDTSE